MIYSEVLAICQDDSILILNGFPEICIENGFPQNFQKFKSFCEVKDSGGQHLLIRNSVYLKSNQLVVFEKKLLINFFNDKNLKKNSRMLQFM